MQKIPSISEQIDEVKIFEIINKNFSKLAPAYYTLVTNWLIDAYKVYNDIDKYIILIYLINKDLIFFRKNGLMIDYDTFYKDKSLEIPKINISDISKDLLIPKESVRRKIQELQKSDIIKKSGKKIFIDRSGFITAKAETTLNELCILINKFSEILVAEKISNKVFDVNEVSRSIKENFSFCWYHFYKLIFIFTNRWRENIADLETLTIGLVVLLNTVENKNFKLKDLNRKKWQKISQGADHQGVNVMSLSEITGIPRPTVNRKVISLIKKNYLNINKKKLITLNMRGSTLRNITKLQDMNMVNLSDCLYRIFNQIKVINTS